MNVWASNGIVLITRPQAQAEIFSEYVHAAGYEPFIFPVLGIEKSEHRPIDISGYGGLIFTSVQGVHHFDAPVSPDNPADIPVYCVGKTIEAALRARGFLRVRPAQKNIAALLAFMKRDDELSAYALGRKPFLYIRGADIRKDIMPALSSYGYHAESVVVYAAKPVCEKDKLIDVIRHKNITMATFFSARTATIFLDCLIAHRHDKAFNDIKFLCISDFVLKCVQGHAAGVHPENIYVSGTPDAQGMISLIKRTCTPTR